MLSVAYWDVSELDIEKAAKYVSSDRLLKASKLKKDTQQKESLGAELLLSSMLGILFPQETLPPAISYDKNGKPHFKEHSNLFFNLSHSNSLVTCAISNKPVGIDLQYMRDFDIKLPGRFFTKDEQDFIFNSTDTKKAFYTIWTKKEALLKCMGRGLCEISSTSVFEAEQQGYSFTCDFFDGFALCVCTKN